VLTEPVRFRIRYEETRTVTRPEAARLQSLDLFVAQPFDAPNQRILQVRPLGQGTPYRSDWDTPLLGFHFQELGPGVPATGGWEADVILWKIRYAVDPKAIGPLTAVPEPIRQKYLQDSEKYNLESDTVRTLAREVAGEERNPLILARKLHDFVQDRLEYLRDDSWDNARTVLERGSGSCSEHVFSFLALARAVGLPARWAGGTRVRGLATASPPGGILEDRIGHRWAEVYLPGLGWFPVDPTEGPFGELPNNQLMMWLAGGQDQRLQWDYRSYARWRYAGGPRPQVEGQRIAHWERLN